MLARTANGGGASTLTQCPLRMCGVFLVSRTPTISQTYFLSMAGSDKTAPTTSMTGWKPLRDMQDGSCNSGSFRRHSIESDTHGCDAISGSYGRNTDRHPARCGKHDLPCRVVPSGA